MRRGILSLYLLWKLVAVSISRHLKHTFTFEEVSTHHVLFDKLTRTMRRRRSQTGLHGKLPPQMSTTGANRTNGDFQCGITGSRFSVSLE